MAYRFAVERADDSVFAGGHVVQSAPGFTAYPARLACEVFRRGVALREAAGAPGPCTLYDPCCGSGHLLVTLAYLCGDRIRALVASDIDADAVRLTERNLALLTPAGLDARVAQLAALHAQYGKASHAEALDHAASLRRLLLTRATSPLVTRVFRADATDAAALRAHLGAHTIDLVVTDVPYGQVSAWQETAEPTGEVEGGEVEGAGEPPAWRLLDALRPALAPAAVVAVSANRQQVVRHPAYRRVDRLQIGKRRIVFLTARDAAGQERRAGEMTRRIPGTMATTKG